MTPADRLLLALARKALTPPADHTAHLAADDRIREEMRGVEGAGGILPKGGEGVATVVEAAAVPTWEEAAARVEANCASALEQFVWGFQPKNDVGFRDALRNVVAEAREAGRAEARAEAWAETPGRPHQRMRTSTLRECRDVLDSGLDFARAANAGWRHNLAAYNAELARRIPQGPVYPHSEAYRCAVAEWRPMYPPTTGAPQ